MGPRRFWCLCKRIDEQDKRLGGVWEELGPKSMCSRRHTKDVTWGGWGGGGDGSQSTSPLSLQSRKGPMVPLTRLLLC